MLTRLRKLSVSESTLFIPTTESQCFGIIWKSNSEEEWHLIVRWISDSLRGIAARCTRVIETEHGQTLGGFWDPALATASIELTDKPLVKGRDSNRRSLLPCTRQRECFFQCCSELVQQPRANWVRGIETVLWAWRAGRRRRRRLPTSGQPTEWLSTAKIRSLHFRATQPTSWCSRSASWDGRNRLGGDRAKRIVDNHNRPRKWELWEHSCLRGRQSRWPGCAIRT